MQVVKDDVVWLLEKLGFTDGLECEESENNDFNVFIEFAKERFETVQQRVRLWCVRVQID